MAAAAGGTFTGRVRRGMDRSPNPRVFGLAVEPDPVVVLALLAVTAVWSVLLALAWVLAVILIVFTLFQVRQSRRWVHYDGD